MKKYFKKLAPDREKILNNKLLSPIAHLLTESRVWHFNRHSVAGGVAIGVFFSMFPIPMHMLLAAFFSVVVFKVNLPLSIVSTFFANPLTMPFIYPFNYYVGASILGKTTHLPEHFHFKEIFHFGEEILVPLMIGSLIMAIVTAVVFYFGIQFLWKYNIYQHRRSRKARNKSIAKPECVNVNSKDL